MEFSASQVARKFEVNRDVVKTWAFRFKNYLSDGANPPKGEVRTFSRDDLRVLAYVWEHWEDNPDIENIMMGLNSGDHGDEIYIRFLNEDSPIFQDPPDYLNEDCRHGTLMGGMMEGIVNNFTVAESYRLAGNILVQAISKGLDGYEIARPILFCYRHAIELYLKSLAIKESRGKFSGKSGHALANMLEKLEAKLKKEHSTVVPNWFKDTVLAFDEFDQFSTTFRYPDGLMSRKTDDSDEYWIDFLVLKDRIGRISEAIKQIRRAFKIIDNT